jgi:FAD dependent oxidoreductase
MDQLNRRGFLGASLAGVTGYSLVVDARAESAPPELGAKPPETGAAAVNAPTSIRGASDRHMSIEEVACDVFIAGGGMSGVCAAISAARNGAKVVLVQDRSRLGGNASSEIGMHVVGANAHNARPGWREGGIIEELRLDDAVHNPHRAFELWDLLLYDKCVSEPNLRLLLDTSVCGADVKNGRITTARARCDKTETLYNVQASVYCDCTGDARLALEAGADFRVGRESQDEFKEPLAPLQGDTLTQGSSILFMACKHDRPMPFVAPSWARPITNDNLKFRGIPRSSFEYGYWWIELGGMYDTIKDNERLRYELLRVVLGVWNWIKNSGERPDSANWALQKVGMIPGKRESRRVLGPHVQTENDLMGGWKKRDDGVAIGGWGFDDHPPGGFDAWDKRPYNSTPVPEVYNIAFDALYSRNIHNLMMAGRNISNTHIAFTSTRVMATCACMGQAVGAAAALASRYRLEPGQLRRQKLGELQQALLRDDQSIRLVKNGDDKDLARSARVAASAVHESAAPEHVINGVTRDMPGTWDNRWAALMTGGEPWIELRWDEPQTVSRVQVVFDTGFHRELTLSASDGVTSRVVRGPQPETVRDYTLSAQTADGTWHEIERVTGNYQRLRRHDFKPIVTKVLRLTIQSTNGSDQARLFEIRCYEE